MRYIDLNNLFARIFISVAGDKVRSRLLNAHERAARMAAVDRKAHIDRNGPNKWKPVKDLATAVLGRKCWYTEVELIGAPLVVDHFRPVCDYWWLAYDPENYRIACPWSNSAEHNGICGCAGGKGDRFPLLPPERRANNKGELRSERPVILDPCSPSDCDLLAFQADGRPIVNPMFAGDAVANQRVEQSNILLNLDHPEFNSKREQLRIAIADDVRAHEALPHGSPEQETIRNRLVARVDPAAPFSIAAGFYLRLHRHLDWVQDILDRS